MKYRRRMINVFLLLGIGWFIGTLNIPVQAATEVAEWSYCAEILPVAGHTPIIDAAVAPTCTQEGLTQGSHCSTCNEVLTEQTKLPVLEHTYAAIITKATLQEDGKATYKCTECGFVDNAASYTWSGIDHIWINDTTKLVYTGKAKKPIISVQAKDGTPIDSKNYDISYKKNKNVGRATVTVTMKGERYSGVLTKDFYILPKGVKKFESLDRGVDSVTVGWKKQTKQITGFQIQYSKRMNFKGAKSVWVKNKKTTKKKIKGLKDNTPYYVRMRTYKTVKTNGKKKKLYSDWSGTNMVCTKEIPVLEPYPTDSVWVGPYEMYKMHLSENGYPYFYSKRDGDVGNDSVHREKIAACKKEGSRYVSIKNYSYNLGIGRWRWGAEVVGEYDGIIVIRRYIEILEYK